MKIVLHILFVIPLFLLTACSNLNNQNPSKIYSKTQQRLYNLLDQYQTEYKNTYDSVARLTIERHYIQKLKELVVDSLGRLIDSIEATVDFVEVTDSVVTTEFHAKEIKFSYSFGFKGIETGSRFDSLFHFMKSLKPNAKVLVDFVNLGSGEIYQPGDHRGTFRFHAYPDFLIWPTK